MMSERSNTPSIFTPPRDDPATRPRLVQIPRDHGDDEEDHKAVVTRQACNMMLFVVFAFLLIICGCAAVYGMVTAAIGKQIFSDCGIQEIENGIIKAGMNGTVAEIQCNEHYLLEEPPGESIRCEMINEYSYLEKRKGKRAIKKYSQMYMFVAHGRHLPRVKVSKFPDGDSLAAKVALVTTTTYEETEGICVLQQIHDSGLKDPQKNAVGSAARLYGQPRKPMDGLAARSSSTGARWSGLSSSMAMASMVVLSLVAVVGAGVNKGADGAPGYRRVGNEPDTALLLDVEGAEDDESTEVDGPRE